MALNIDTNLTMSPRITQASPRRQSVPAMTVAMPSIFLVESSPPSSETSLEDTDKVSTTAIKSPTTAYASSCSRSSLGKARKSCLERASNILKISQGFAHTKRLVHSAETRLKRLVHKLIKAPHYIDASLDGVDSATFLARAPSGTPEKQLSFSSDDTLTKFATTCSPVDILRASRSSTGQWSLPTLISSPSPIMQLHNITNGPPLDENSRDMNEAKDHLRTERTRRPFRCD